MIKLKHNNLVVYTVPLDNEGEKYKQLRINTTLLTKITASEGQRWNKRETASRRLRKIWDTKHPVLSKFFVPVSLWANEFGYYDRWIGPKVTVEYVNEEVIRVAFKSNQLALQARDLMVKHFWGDE